MYYDIDNWGFKKNILLPLCNSYVEFYEQQIYSSNTIEKQYIEERIGLLFKREVFIVGFEKKEKILPFKKVQKQFKNIVDNKFMLLSGSWDEKNFISNYFMPHRKLLSLLIKRQKNLFDFYETIPDQYRYMPPLDSIIHITANTGDSNINEYRYYNYRLYGGMENSLCFNYESCKNEIETIKANMNKKETNSSLVDGL